jgi:hypothetical protein
MKRLKELSRMTLICVSRYYSGFTTISNNQLY